MEIQFQKKAIGYLQTLLRQQQKQEQTQQIRLSDAMPDIGRVLGCWGQILIRGKEWHGGSVGVSGGVMAWVLYQPEGDGEPCCADAWIPFQMKWDIDETDRDGIMEVQATLCHMDARMLSDRKLMVRANIGVQMHAMVQTDAVQYTPGEIPAELEVLQQTYPVMLPVEAGEKLFDIEQQLEIPPDGARVHKIIHFSARPMLTEYKIVADKLVLRGSSELYVLYMDEFGKIHRRTWQMPFSQYTQLDGEYSPETEVESCFALTQLEIELTQPDALVAKVGFAMQYTVLLEQDVTVAQDMYSITREVKAEEEQLRLPAVLQRKTQNVRAEISGPEGRILDVIIHLEAPKIMRNQDDVNAELEGIFQVLYEDPEGNLQTTVERWQKNLPTKVAEDAEYQVSLAASANMGNEMGIGFDLQWDEKVISNSPIQMITGGDMGESVALNPLRPSIILRRAGTDSLWEIARSTGSTMDAIRKANNLQQEPEKDQMLLIPVS